MGDLKPYIVILTDGRPGHETQSSGIAKILNRKQEYQIDIIQLRKTSKKLKQVFKAFYSFLSKQWMLNFFIDQDSLRELKNKKISYIISAGGDTLLPNALLKIVLHEQSTKNIIATSLRGMPVSAFDGVFTIDPRYAGISPYLYYPIVPNKLMSFDLHTMNVKSRQQFKISFQQKVWTILIGANTDDVKIGCVENWIKWINFLQQRYPSDYFIISTSRRTPLIFETSLQQAFAQRENIHLVLFNSGDHQPVCDLLYVADGVICSPDSTSMISESLMLEKPVFYIQFEDTVMSKEFEQYYQDKKTRGWVKQLQMYDDIAQKVEDFQPVSHVQALVKVFYDIEK